MKKNIFLITAFIVFALFSCTTKTAEVEVNGPVAVQKESTKKIYVHMMTWFADKATNAHPDPKYVGGWGAHWTMDNQNPDSIVDPVTGKKQIAAHYYPLTGPYASSDKDIIEYQLLLMKLAGIDGIIFNYTTLNPEWDFPMLVAATDSIARQTEKFGLDIAIMYEDQHVRDASGRKELTTDSISRAKEDMQYIKQRYFSQPNYIKVDGRPILLDFGPQYYKTEAEWTDIFSVFGEEQPAFYALNYHGHHAGKNTYGEYAWIWKDFLDGLRHFYNKYEYAGDKMGVAYPGFHDFYNEGGWRHDEIGWTIPHKGDTTFTQTLQLALTSEVEMIQLATWNDYGEGTMIEPTMEFGYSFLTALQRELGVKDLSQKDLELVFELYNARINNKNSAEIQAQLDKASALIAALKTDEARNIINKIAEK